MWWRDAEPKKYQSQAQHAGSIPPQRTCLHLTRSGSRTLFASFPGSSYLTSLRQTDGAESRMSAPVEKLHTWVPRK